MYHGCFVQSERRGGNVETFRAEGSWDESLIQGFIGRVLLPGVGTAACRDNLKNSRPEEVWNKGVMKFFIYSQIPYSESLLESCSWYISGDILREDLVLEACAVAMDNLYLQLWDAETEREKIPWWMSVFASCNTTPSKMSLLQGVLELAVEQVTQTWPLICCPSAWPLLSAVLLACRQPCLGCWRGKIRRTLTAPFSPSSKWVWWCKREQRDVQELFYSLGCATCLFHHGKILLIFGKPHGVWWKEVRPKAHLVEYNTFLILGLLLLL